ncbi:MULTISPECIES: C4-dicarboxylate TRAP transporter substrate-binding protein [Marinovum]|uniref:C4-dicarboxylate TRAP transporter substrate-binding protein n=1 Tax=Marinovum TaxID=367771 RepID=UPI00237AFB74|nr:C4-dicarboxylate TRAP transporter substrate-binding protein [Marinovum sp. PR37]MDD9746425.1 C4-dicarboxylate TRAP transporter substrate-binding protein [Marinovum sp. PR37]
MVLRNLVLALGVATAGLSAQEVGAKSLTLAVGVGPKNSITLTMQGFADYMAEHTDIDIKIYPLSLLNLKETPPGLRDGLADIGFVLTPYYPAEYSEMNLAANLGMLSTAGVQVASPGAAIAGAMSEYVLNCPECLAEFKAQKQVYLGSGIGSTYMMLCTAPVQSVADIKGKKFRSGSDNFSRWAEHFGGIAVSLPGNDQYEAMSQGVIDCTMASATELTNYSLFDVTKSVTLGIPGGNFAGVATNNFNVDVWKELTDDERKAALMGSARSAADLTWRYYMDSERDLTAAPEKGITVLEPSAEVRAMSDAFVMEDLKVIEEQFTSGYGLINVGEKIAEFSRLVEKWKGLTADIGGDQEALAQIYWDEIFSKVDPATYAMN